MTDDRTNQILDDLDAAREWLERVKDTGICVMGVDVTGDGATVHAFAHGRHRGPLRDALAMSGASIASVRIVEHDGADPWDEPGDRTTFVRWAIGDRLDVRANASYGTDLAAAEEMLPSKAERLGAE